MNPYKSLSTEYFWATAVARLNMFDISGLWKPKFRIGRRMKVVTFGSCFAQHIGRALKQRGFDWHLTEQAPAGLSPEGVKKFNYGVFSARTGNIYTASLLKQWLDWASGAKAVPDEIWEKGGRFFDPFRPNIEPDGFASADELLKSRARVIEAFRRSVTESDVFVFTLGLTESWFDRVGGWEYPMCPGTVAGTFDPDRHEFVNQDYSFIRKTLAESIQEIRRLNPKVRILLTVSPVPLTATMSGNHVLVATMESKSILRAVAGSLQKRFAFVDYFPSYEIINSAPYRGTFFEANQRSVNHAGVDHVMTLFFQGLQTLRSEANAPDGEAATEERERNARPEPVKSAEDVVCEEELLAAFSARG